MFLPRYDASLKSLLKAKARRTHISFILAFVVLALGLFYWLEAAKPHSVQAFVNTDIVILRAPVAGKLTLAPGLQVGRPVAASQKLGEVVSELENPRVSQLRIQQEELRAHVATLETQLSGIDHRLADRTSLIERFDGESREEKRLRLTLQQAQLKSAQADLQSMKAKADMARSSEKRARALSADGYVSLAGLETSISAGQAAAAEYEAQKARVAEYEAQVAASESGLELDGPRSLSQPEARLRELRSESVDMEQQRKSLSRTLDTARVELEAVSAEFQRQRHVDLTSPQAAVLWSVDARSGSTVAANGTVLELANCAHVWVESFFDEADAAKLAIGQPVKVRLIYGGQLRNGTVETIRAGSGRVDVGDYVVLPPPEISRRQLPVRVITVRVRVDWADGDLAPAQFCLAGRSAEVFMD